MSAEEEGGGLPKKPLEPQDGASQQTENLDEEEGRFMSSSGIWEKYLIEKSGEFVVYYYNTETRKSQWTKPDEFIDTPIVVKKSTKRDGSIIGDPPKTPKRSARRDRLAIQMSLFTLLLGSLIGGGIAAGVTYAVITYAIPSLAVFGVTSLLGLTGMGIPLVLAAAVGALLGTALLALLELRFFKNNQQTLLFMRNLVILFSLLGGAALGVFLVATTPAIAVFLTFGFMQPLGVFAPFIVAGAAALVLTGLVALAIYRGMGIHKIELSKPADKPTPPDDTMDIFKKARIISKDLNLSVLELQVTKDFQHGSRNFSNGQLIYYHISRRAIIEKPASYNGETVISTVEVAEPTVRPVVSSSLLSDQTQPKDGKDLKQPEGVGFSSPIATSDSGLPTDDTKNISANKRRAESGNVCEKYIIQGGENNGAAYYKLTTNKGAVTRSWECPIEFQGKFFTSGGESAPSHGK